MATAPLSKSDLMRAAWQLFRQHYGFGSREAGGRGLSFRRIGRTCFGWCLKKAWADARQRARLAAIPAPVKAERIASLRQALFDTRDYFTGSYAAQCRREAEINTEIFTLLAA